MQPTLDEPRDRRAILRAGVMATFQTTIATVLYVAVVLAFCFAFFFVFYVRVDTDGRWWVRSKYGGYRIRLSTWFLWLAVCAFLFFTVYLFDRLMRYRFPN